MSHIGLQSWRVTHKPPDTSTVDFNVHVSDLLRKISQERNIKLQILFIICLLMFCPTISKPTRVTNYSATLIDNIITNIHEYPIKSGILYNDISDHFPVFNIYKLDWQKGNSTVTDVTFREVWCHIKWCSYQTCTS